jgi:hypothetical protein
MPLWTRLKMVFAKLKGAPFSTRLPALDHKLPATAEILLRRSKGKDFVMTRIHWVTRGGTRVERCCPCIPWTGVCHRRREPRSRVSARTATR